MWLAEKPENFIPKQEALPSNIKMAHIDGGIDNVDIIYEWNEELLSALEENEVEIRKDGLFIWWVEMASDSNDIISISFSTWGTWYVIMKTRENWKYRGSENTTYHINKWIITETSVEKAPVMRYNSIIKTRLTWI